MYSVDMILCTVWIRYCVQCGYGDCVQCGYDIVYSVQCKYDIVYSVDTVIVYSVDTVIVYSVDTVLFTNLTNSSPMRLQSSKGRTGNATVPEGGRDS